MKRVLLLEDDFEVSLGISSVLKDHGLDVDVFTTASDAIGALEAEPYDLVIADMIIRKDNRTVPDGGVILLGWLRSPKQADQNLHALPVICISGATRQIGMANILDMGRSLGADVCLEKPFHDDDLIDAVLRLLKMR